MPDLQLIFGTLVATALGYLLYRKFWRRRQSADSAPSQMFRDVAQLLDGASLHAGEAIGTWKMQGKYQGHVFQLKSIVDTLMTRKLPSLWLMVTLPEPQHVSATFDLMMRPAGPTTFSNFDFLPHSLRTPVGFPEHAVIRTDQAGALLPSGLIGKHLGLFHDRRGKELLVSPIGLRIVMLIAEADRARYGVLREANFGDTVIDAQLAQQCMDTLLDLQHDLVAAHE
jgi:hypothetical protein